MTGRHTTVWETYPEDYRQREVQAILRATAVGECVSVIGLSGAGKSNLLSFLAWRKSTTDHPLLLVDCNRLLEHTPLALIRLIRHVLEKSGGQANEPGRGDDPLLELETLNRLVDQGLDRARTITLLFDRFEIFSTSTNQPLYNTLRALRDDHKFRLAFVTATRRPLPGDNELAELFHAHTIWLGPLSERDALWNVVRYSHRIRADWDRATADQLIELSGGYASLLRAACEAYASGIPLKEVAEHPVVQARIDEFWRDEPSDDALRLAGLAGHALLLRGRAPTVADEQLTAKEQLLFDTFKAHPNEVCDKDDLIRAVWPEDAVYEEGVRDSSLAQLVRRLRLKIEPDPADPRFIHTVPGRGYLYRPP